MIRAPKYLSEKSKEFFKKINKEFELEDNHIKILILACECLDRIEEVRLQIEKEGAFYNDRFG